MPIVASPDTVSQPAPNATLTIEHSHGTRFNVLRGNVLLGWIGLRYDNQDRPRYWAVPVERSYPTVEAAMVAIERAAVRAEAERAA